MKAVLRVHGRRPQCSSPQCMSPPATVFLLMCRLVVAQCVERLQHFNSAAVLNFNAATDKVTISNSVFSFIGIPEPGLGGKIASMPFERWPYFTSYGAYFRNAYDVVLDDVSFSTVGPDDRESIFTDNVGYLKR